VEFLLEALMKDIPDTALPADHSPNLEAIAQKAPTAEINTLLKLCFLAAARRREKKQPPYAEFYSLSQETINMIIGSLEKAPQSAPWPSPPTNGTFVESDVYLEERLNQTTADLIRLQAYVKDIEEASDGYRAERDGLEEELRGTQNDLEDAKSSLNAHVRTRQQQRDEILKLETLIAEHEVTMRSNDKLIEDLQKSNASLGVNVTNVQELEDKIQELRVQNTNLKRTANTVEKYKEKLKLQADVQAENEQLKHEMKQLQDYVAQLEAAKNDPRIESSLRELQKVVSAQEIQLRDSATEKQHLHVNIKALEETNQLLKAQTTRDREEIEELQEKLAAASTLSSPSTPKAPNRDPGFDRIQETAR
jgi:myosin heavy subunit